MVTTALLATSRPAAYWPRAAIQFVFVPLDRLMVQVLETTTADQYFVPFAASVSPSNLTLVAPPAGMAMRCPPLVETPCTLWEPPVSVRSLFVLL